MSLLLTFGGDSEQNQRCTWRRLHGKRHPTEPGASSFTTILFILLRFLLTSIHYNVF
jgi:hypothetical protein